MQNHPNTRRFPVGNAWAQREIRLPPWGRALLVTLASVFVLSVAVLLIVAAGGHGPGFTTAQVLARLSPVFEVAALSGIGFGWLAWHLGGAPRRDQESYYRLTGRAELPHEKRLALRLDVVSAFTHGHWVETLENYPQAALLPTAHRAHGKPALGTLPLGDPPSYRRQLDEDWDCHGAQDYRAIRQRLLEGMHSSLFDRDMGAADPEDRVLLAAELAGLTGLPARAVRGSAEAGPDGAPAASLWGFDLWRALHLSRTAFCAGYIAEDEAWRDVLDTAARVHARFDSFDAFWTSHRLGHAYWCRDADDVTERREQYEQFLRECDWPIKDLPWPARSSHGQA